MKKIIRLTENDLMKLVKRVIKEQNTNQITFTNKCSKKLNKAVYVLPNSTLNLSFPTGDDMSINTSKGERYVQSYVIDTVTVKEQVVSKDQPYQSVVIELEFVYDTPITEQTCVDFINTFNKYGGFIKDSNPSLIGSQKENKTLTFTPLNNSSIQCVLKILIPNGINVISNLQSEKFV